MRKNDFITAALLLSLAVALGAFGAHALKSYLDATALNTYQTAVQYHFIHALGLAIAALVAPSADVAPRNWAARLFKLGLLLFSGSLYLMSFLKAAGYTGVGWLGAITPFGGLCFVVAWLLLAWSVRRISH